MNYEIVNLEEKIVAGFSARTNNASPDMGRLSANSGRNSTPPKAALR